MRNKKMYNIINIVGGTMCVILIGLLFVFKDQKIIIGVLFRGVFSLLIIYNAIYIAFTNNPSFMIRKGQEKHRKLLGIFLLLLGIFAFVTALLGYGINGYPLLDWRTVF